MLIHLGNAAAGIHSTAELAGTLGDGSLNGRITTAGGSAFGQETLGILRRLLLQPAVVAVAGEPADKHEFNQLAAVRQGNAELRAQLGGGGGRGVGHGGGGGGGGGREGGGDTNVTIFGYGSLMSKKDAERTAKKDGFQIQNHRPAILIGWSRTMSLTTGPPRNPRRVWLAARQGAAEGTVGIAGALFEIDAQALAGFQKREFEYDQVNVRVHEVTGGISSAGPLCLGGEVGAIMFAESTDAKFKAKCDAISETMFLTSSSPERTGRWGNTKWTVNDDDREYLDICLKAASDVGPDFEDNFLHSTTLADGCTTVAQFRREGWVGVEYCGIVSGQSAVGIVKSRGAIMRSGVEPTSSQNIAFLAGGTVVSVIGCGNTADGAERLHIRVPGHGRLASSQ